VEALTGQGERAVADLATRYGVSVDAVLVLLEAVRVGNGTMAQFSHPEFGGSGQWMAGGMTMAGTMFDNRLRSLVSGLAGELAALLAAGGVYAVHESTPAGGGLGPSGSGSARSAYAGSWWPAELGNAGSSGSQNDTRYAVFPLRRRLALRSGTGPVRVHDTLDHVIGGVQQQQGGQPGTLTFTSQHGTFTVDALPLASPGGASSSAAPDSAAGPDSAAAPDLAAGPDPAAEPATRSRSAPGAVAGPAGLAVPTPSPVTPARDVAGADAAAILATLARLGELHDRGVLTDEEFTAKKADLLARL